MAVTLNKIVSDIRNIATSGKATDDFRITDRQIEYWIHEVRSILIGQAIAKRQDYSDSWIQTIGCLELEQADVSDCCDAPIGCYVLRSVRTLPATIETDKNNEIISVSTMDGYPITETTQFSNIYKKYNKYTGKNMGWFFKNDYLYIINDDLLATVSVRGIFEDPQELGEFFTCDGDPCWTIDSDYPCSMKMASMITDIVLKTKVNPLLTYPVDVTGDGANGLGQKK